MAQGKVGSGFDVCTAAFGSMRYTRVTPATMQSFLAMADAGASATGAGGGAGAGAGATSAGGAAGGAAVGASAAGTSPAAVEAPAIGKALAESRHADWDYKIVSGLSAPCVVWCGD